MKKYVVIWLLIGSFLIAGCGQTGRLYLPKAEENKSPPEISADAG